MKEKKNKTCNSFIDKFFPGLLFILIYLMIHVHPVFCEASETMVTLEVNSGRIREKPCFNADVEFGLTKGDAVPVIETKGKWYRVKIKDGRTGWGHQSIFSEPYTIQNTEQVSGGHHTKDTLPKKEQPESEEVKPTVAQPESEEVRPAVSQPEAEEVRPAVSPAEEEKPASKELEEIRVEITPQGEEKAILVLNGFYPPQTFAIEDGTPKVVCDFFGVNLGERITNRIIEVNGNFIRIIRIGVHKDDNPKIRIVIDLAPNRDYDVEQIFLREELLYILTFKSDTKISANGALDTKYGF